VSLADNPTAVEAARKALREAGGKYTMMDLNQRPGEGNYDRIEELTICDVLRAAEAVGLPLDERDTLVMRKPTKGG
jgi:hypothetical protein